MSDITESGANVANNDTLTTHATNNLFGLAMPFDFYSMGYALMVATGGIMGYVKAQSIPSLAAGLTFGALIGAGSVLEATHDNYWLTFASSGVLGAIMGKRFLASHKFMPAGLITILSLGMVIRYGIRTYQLTTNRHHSIK
ncbi:Transmembrane protein 14C [Fragariocoptes setiger]|uniref:Transmembrane protein 14C n=1 Tax=Fragariocoptes setiger TaxID=1670756 RepID=A0ABQ7S565_9ACAR|nr:Transmembrane protein 14C [Fragariocoptes setiger]